MEWFSYLKLDRGSDCILVGKRNIIFKVFYKRGIKRIMKLFNEIEDREKENRGCKKMKGKNDRQISRKITI